MARALIAAFDLDGTLLDGQSGTLILGYLARRRLVTPKTTLMSGWWGVRYKLHLPLRQNEVRERIFGDLGELPPEQVDQIMRDFHCEVMVPRYRREGLETLRRCGADGLHTVLISATFDQVAQEAARYLGCDAALATVMERDAEGHYTGEVAGEVTAGPEKAARIRAWADAAFGRDGWEVARAYGDHYSDLPMLELARECYAVNPGPTLRREAARRDWPVLSWN